MVCIVANFAELELHATLLLSFRCLIGFCLQNQLDKHWKNKEVGFDVQL